MKKIFLTFFFLAVIFLFLITNYSFATEQINNSSDWNVKITCGTQDLTIGEMEEIVFAVNESENVKSGEIAPRKCC